MDTMLSPDEEYPFDKIKIKTPKALQGGTYCANLEIENGPVIIQTPKCKTKNGIHKTAKQIYCDLVMNRDHQIFLDNALEVPRHGKKATSQYSQPKYLMKNLTQP